MIRVYPQATALVDVIVTTYRAKVKVTERTLKRCRSMVSTNTRNDKNVFDCLQILFVGFSLSLCFAG